MPVELIPQALCSVGDVKAILVAGSDRISSTPDDLLTLLINGFSESIEGSSFTNRKLLISERTEYHDGGGTRLWVKAPPIAIAADGITPILSVYDDPDHLWGEDTIHTLWDDYGVRVEKGCIWQTYGGVFSEGSRSVKVVYTGGIVTANDPNSVPFDLRILGCAMQVANWFQRKGELGLDTISVPGGGSVSMNDPSRYLSSVMKVIQNYKYFGGPWA